MDIVPSGSFLKKLPASQWAVLLFEVLPHNKDDSPRPYNCPGSSVHRFPAAHHSDGILYKYKGTTKELLRKTPCFLKSKNKSFQWVWNSGSSPLHQIQAPIIHKNLSHPTAAHLRLKYSILQIAKADFDILPDIILWSVPFEV